MDEDAPACAALPFEAEGVTSVSTSSAATVTSKVSVQGIAVHVRGDGESVLLLHGIGGNAASCAGLATELAEAGYRTFCWDAPGYGDSADPDGDHDSFGALVGLVEELAVDLGGPLHVFGTSWGGVLALELASRRPDLVTSLIVADSSRGSGTTPEKAAAMRARPAELAVVGAAEFAGQRSPKLVSPQSGIDVAAAVQAEMARVRVPGYSAAAEYMASRDLGPALATIAVPTLVLVGRDDVVTGVEESRLLARGIPEAQLKVIEGAGHAAVSEAPATMAAHIIAFLAGLGR